MDAIELDLQRQAKLIYGPHPPLDSSKQEIRLLSLLPTSDGSLSGKLEIASVKSDFTALSYVWGDSANRQHILLNNVNTTITTNLAEALLQLQREDNAQRIWVDAVCINQIDGEEKNKQVAMMSDIYSHAERTFIWLGESKDDSDLAIDFIENIEQQNFDDFNQNNPDPAWLALEALFRREWWGRMWVIQETMLSRKPLIKCGSKVVEFDKFPLLKSLHDHNAQMQLDRFTLLRQLFSNAPFQSLLSLNWREGIHGTLSAWLIAVRTFKCLVLRDRVYALLGMTKKGTRQQIEVSYDDTEKSDRDVVIETAMLLFQEIGLMWLQIAQDEKEEKTVIRKRAADEKTLRKLKSSLPSWCPDWTIDTSLVTFIRSAFNFHAFPVDSAFKGPPVGQCLFRGESSLTYRFVFSTDKEILFLRGFIIGTVDFVSKMPIVPIYEGDNRETRHETNGQRAAATMNACLSWEAHVQGHKQDAYSDTVGGYAEAFYRTIVADRYYYGPSLSGMEDIQPADSAVQGKFNAWVGRGFPTDLSVSSEAERLNYVRSYSYTALTLCNRRAFFTTTNGLFGLGLQKVREGDLVCLLYSGDVAYILRPNELDPAGKPGSFVGEAYVHGVMQGEYLETAKPEDFTMFWVT